MAGRDRGGEGRRVVRVAVALRAEALHDERVGREVREAARGGAAGRHRGEARAVDAGNAGEARHELRVGDRDAAPALCARDEIGGAGRHAGGEGGDRERRAVRDQRAARQGQIRAERDRLRRAGSRADAPEELAGGEGDLRLHPRQQLGARELAHGAALACEKFVGVGGGNCGVELVDGWHRGQLPIRMGLPFWSVITAPPLVCSVLVGTTATESA